MRTFGVEEEFLIVDETSGVPLALGAEIVACWQQRHQAPGFTLTTELQREQVELVTDVCASGSELEKTLRFGRERVDMIAREFGARIVAVGASPLPVEPHLTRGRRYAEVSEVLRTALDDQLTCGFHVHVGIESHEEGVGVLDRIRVWLPVLLALSSNSPFWNGRATGYESYRRALWTHLPLAGPAPLFGSAAAYHAHLDELLDTEVILDTGMVFFDARLSESHPTVEVRVADVCPSVGVAVLLATLTRALVETEARQWERGEPAPTVSTDVLELAMWRAAKDGLYGQLLHPADWQSRDALDVVASLMKHVTPVLTDWGEVTEVATLMDRLLSEGTGAQRQRQVHHATKQLTDVVAEASRWTQET